MYKEIEIGTSEDLLRTLDPTTEDWSGWVFRGQPNSNYKLMPSIWREEQTKQFIIFKDEIKIGDIQDKVCSTLKSMEFNPSDSVIHNIVDAFLHIKFENYLLAIFYEQANKVGLKIPERALELIKTYSASYWKKSDITAFPWGNLLSGYKQKINIGSKQIRFGSMTLFEPYIPQHYGLPTRILDWTMHPRKAIFFAAYHFLKKALSEEETKVKNEKISIFALKLTGTENKNGSTPILVKTNFNKHDNIFLRMQEGVFTKVYGEFYFFENGKWPAIEDFSDEIDNDLIQLKKFNIPATLSKDLLARLEKDNIFLSMLMPTYSHVSEEVRDFIYTIR